MRIVWAILLCGTIFTSTAQIISWPPTQPLTADLTLKDSTNWQWKANGTFPVVWLQHQFYGIAFDTINRLPFWSYHVLTKTGLDSANLPRTGSFGPDPMYAGVQATNEDYYKSGYDRGHFVPCEDMSFSSISMAESFFYTNCAPQTPKMNRGQWARLEMLVRYWAKENAVLEVFAGFIPEPNLPIIGPGKIPVPRYYFKVVIDRSLPVLKGIAFIMPNQQDALEPPVAYAVSIDEVERKTGLNFLPFLTQEEEQKIESKWRTNDWVWFIPKPQVESTVPEEPK